MIIKKYLPTLLITALVTAITGATLAYAQTPSTQENRDSMRDTMSTQEEPRMNQENNMQQFNNQSCLSHEHMNWDATKATQRMTFYYPCDWDLDMNEENVRVRAAQVDGQAQMQFPASSTELQGFEQMETSTITVDKQDLQQTIYQGQSDIMLMMVEIPLETDVDNSNLIATYRTEAQRDMIEDAIQAMSFDN